MKPVRERGQALQSNVPMASAVVAVARLLVHEGARLAKGFVTLGTGPACVSGGLHGLHGLYGLHGLHKFIFIFAAGHGSGALPSLFIFGTPTPSALAKVGWFVAAETRLVVFLDLLGPLELGTVIFGKLSHKAVRDSSACLGVTLKLR